MEFYQHAIEVFGSGVTLGFDEKGIRNVVLDDSMCFFYLVLSTDSGNSCSSCRGGGAGDSSRFGIDAKDLVLPRLSLARLWLSSLWLHKLVAQSIGHLA